MSKKQNVKKVLSLLTVLTLVICTTVSVSASATYSTTTSYDMSLNKVTVTSTIFGVQDGEQITYLAYDSGQIGITKDNIVYIDQKAAGTDITGTCAFTYTADVSKIGTTVVKFGAQNTAAADITGDATNTIKSYNVNVTAGSGGTVTPTTTVIGGKDCSFTITPSDGQKIASVTYNGVSVPLSQIIWGGTCSSFTIPGISADGYLQVTFATKDPVAISDVTQGRKFGTPQLSGTTNNNITTYSTVAVADSGVSTYEYGVLFSYKNNATFADTGKDAVYLAANKVAGSVNKLDKTGAIKYQALGKGVDGTFAVKLIDNGSGLLQGVGTYYTIPYLVVNGDYANAKYGAYTEYISQ